MDRDGLRVIYEEMSMGDIKELLLDHGVDIPANMSNDKSRLIDYLIDRDLQQNQSMDPSTSRGGGSSSYVPPPTSKSSSSSSSPSSLDIQSFVEITGSDPATARSYLEMMNGNVEQAVAFFLDQDHGQSNQHPKTGTSTTTKNYEENHRNSKKRNRGSSNFERIVHDIDDGDDYLNNTNFSSNSNTKANGKGTDNSWKRGDADGEEDNVRAFDLQKNESLIGGRANHHMSSGLGIGLSGGVGGMHGIGGEINLNPAAFGGRMGGGISGGSVDPDKDKWMFPPPKNIYPGDLPTTIALCKESRKWLLVNIQNIKEFECHALNRDVWSDDTVTSILENAFVLWQRSQQSGDATDFLSKYSNVMYQTCPIVVIIDPRTGVKLVEFNRKQLEKPDVFSSQLMEFLEENNFEEFSVPKDLRRKSNSNPGTGQGGPTLHERRVSDLQGEDDDLAKAIAMSLNENQNQQHATTSATGKREEDKNGQHNDDTEDKGGESKGKLMEDQDEENDENANRCIVNLPLEPPSSTPAEEISSISFRLADNSRKTRTFYNSDKVEGLYAFVEDIVPDAKRKVSAKKSAIGTHDYDLSFGFPLQSLSSKMDMTIGETKLNKKLVTMRFLN